MNLKIYAPDYYKDFKCIAGKCRHSCCIGWEIDIDDETNAYYKTVKGDMGKRLAASISNEEQPHFVLSENERCPFLNKNNLCDIIINLGEDKLCQICSDHPRFRNFFDSRIEIGLGLCCEAAGELIINSKSYPKLIVAEDDGEDEEMPEIEEMFFNMRNKIFKIIENNRFSDCIEKILDEFQLSIPQKSIFEWAKIYLSLERLDDKWTDMLTDLKGFKDFNTEEKCENELKQLLIYFIYRHLSDGLYEGNIRERLAFSVLSVYMIKWLSGSVLGGYENITQDVIIEVSRMYSSEIEYSSDNMEALFEVLE